jgi:hypothetical protein
LYKQLNMGTRSTYRVIKTWTDEKGNVKKNNILLLYRQMDGYPEGHPLDTAKWLASGRVVNGLSLNEPQLVFNGAGCLAAQLVVEHKDGPGGAYIHPLNYRGKCWENYTYDIIVNEDKTIEFIAYEVGGMKKPSFKKIFEGTPQQFVEKYETVNV